MQSNLTASVLRTGVAAVAIFFALSLIAVVPGSPLGVAVAQDEEKPPEKTRKTQAISAKVYEKLAKAQEAAEAKQYNQAISILDALRRSQGEKLKGYDAASVWNVYGFIYYSQEQYRKAIGAYKKVVEQGEIPEALEVGTKYTIAQLYFVVEDYPAAIRAMNTWFKVANNPGPDPYILLGQAYYQTKDYNRALQQVERGMATARKREIAPKEHWYLLLRVLYYEKNNYAKTTETLEQLVRRWPKREYWVQLAGMYGELKKEKKQLVTMEAAYVQDMLQREGELLNMAYLFLGNDMPYKAARVVEKGLKEEKIKPTTKNYELLGNAWRQAQETKKAIPALEKAASRSDKGEIYARLAGVYLDNEEYNKSIRAARDAINKGGVKRRDNVFMIKGMAEFNSDKLNAALGSFRKCAEDKRSKSVCNQWYGFVQKDQKRRQQLAEDLKALKNARDAKKAAAEEATS
ncbi:MAG: tetratricopeptide repeat protein [Pseudomonadales bacterium]